IGLLEDLYRRGEVADLNGEVLVRMRRMPLEELLDALSPDTIVLLREAGTPTSMEELAARLVAARRPLIGIGGFPAGDFSDRILKLFPIQMSLGRASYSAGLVACRLVYEVEKHSLARRAP
ncbi:MAG: hypothetical protein RAK18_07315, partial [Conexivisphaerales archaeon]|nr:hypothetical protein [Conexivisphaerales archaeon]